MDHMKAYFLLVGPPVPPFPLSTGGLSKALQSSVVGQLVAGSMAQLAHADGVSAQSVSPKAEPELAPEPEPELEPELEADEP